MRSKLTEARVEAGDYSTADVLVLLDEVITRRDADALARKVDKVPAGPDPRVLAIIRERDRLRAEVKRLRADLADADANRVQRCNELTSALNEAVRERDEAQADRDDLQRDFDNPNGPMARAIAGTMYRSVVVERDTAFSEIKRLRAALAGEADLAATTSERPAS